MYSTLETKHLDAYNKNNGNEHGIILYVNSYFFKVL